MGCNGLEIADVLSQIDGERIYRHVLKLQGVRHPIDARGRLDEAADYLHSEFESFGLTAADQVFTVSGFDGTFRNIEGSIDDGKDPELLIVAHYDTVENSPGANDNASGLAVMLEAARVLARNKTRNVRFVGFTLEEGNPTFALKSRQLAQSLGLIDAQNRYTSLRVSEVIRKFNWLQRKYWMMGKNLTDALSAARTELEAQMTESEIMYVKQLEQMFAEITPMNWPGKTGIMGSSFWVEEAVREHRKVLGVLCFETIGYTSEQEHSQRLPQGITLDMFQLDNIGSDDVGNFLVVIGDVNSEKLVQSFSANAALESVNLPCAALHGPFGYEQIAGRMGDLLRSDHAPFWRQGIPALFMTDSADFRYPYYHTEADTIDKLDFTFMTKICQATVATALHLTGQSHP